MALSFPIVALGDSKTAGIGDTPGRGGYPRRLAERLYINYPTSRVIAIGESGWSSSDLIQYGLPRAIEVQPQIALLWVGSNDVWECCDAPDPATPLHAFQSNLAQICATLHNANIRMILGLLDDQSRRPMIQQMEEMTANEQEHIREMVEHCNTIITTTAHTYQAPLVDFFHTTIFSEQATVADDGNHPNERGYDHIEQLWFAALEPLL